VIHILFKSNVNGLEDEDGTTSIEYTFDGTSNAVHNNVLLVKYESKTYNSKDVSFAELYDPHNEFLIAGPPDNEIVKIQIITEVSFHITVNEVHPILYTNLTSNSSTLLTQFKTVSLLI